MHYKNTFFFEKHNYLSLVHINIKILERTILKIYINNILIKCKTLLLLITEHIVLIKEKAAIANIIVERCHNSNAKMFI